MSFTPEQIAKALDAKASGISTDDLTRIAAAADAVRRKLSEFPPALAMSRARGEVLLAMALDDSVDLHARKMAAGAILYLASPLDLIPDHEPNGYDDDAAVVDLAAWRTEKELTAFCERARVTLPELG